MMPDKLQHHALFKDPSHLLSALHLLIPGRDPFPARLLFVQNRGWAIEAGDLGSRDNLSKLASQHGWEVEFPRALTGQWVPTASALAGGWTYRDPLQAAEWAGHSAAPPPDGSTWAWLDPGAPYLQFFLAARDEAQAQRILDVLCAHFSQGIRAVPILLEPAAGASCPFHYFWSVSLERPNPFLFEPAERVWWGPVGHGRVQIFLQYPWSLAVPIDLLHRIPWGPDTGIVLLSKDSPEVVELRLAPDGFFTEFPGAVELKRGAAQVSLPVVVSQSKPSTRFKVDIRLGGPDPRVVARKRIEDLEREISAKRLLVEHMRARGDQAERDDVAAEPLFLYAQQPADRDRIPPEIQRLLIEWADQPEDLGAVSYAFLPGEALPQGLFLEGTSLHVVAAATALGEAGSYAVGARLLDYAPQALNSGNLMLDRDWADYRLRLFAPATGHIWLYPNLRPSPSTAALLASAIHPEAGARREEWLYLLLPGFDGQLHFLLLPTHAFKPLAEGFQWVLDIDAGISMANAGSQLRGRVLSSVCDAMDANLTAAVQREATTRLAAATGRLKGEAAALETQLNDRSSRIRNAEALAREFGKEMDGVEKSLRDAAKISLELTSELQGLEGSFQTVGNHLESLRQVIGRHVVLQRRIRDQITAVSEIRSRLNQSTK